MRKFLVAAAIATVGLTASLQAGANCNAADFDGHWVGLGNGNGRDGFHQALYCEINIKSRQKYLEFGAGSVCTTIPGGAAHRALLFSAEAGSDCQLNNTAFMALLGFDDQIEFKRAAGDRTQSGGPIDTILIAGYYFRRPSSSFTMTLTRAR